VGFGPVVYEMVVRTLTIEAPNGMTLTLRWDMTSVASVRRPTARVANLTMVTKRGEVDYGLRVRSGLWVESEERRRVDIEPVGILGLCAPSSRNGRMLYALWSRVRKGLAAGLHDRGGRGGLDVANSRPGW
jgi:hypothetical protein